MPLPSTDGTLRPTQLSCTVALEPPGVNVTFLHLAQISRKGLEAGDEAMPCQGTPCT